jgi:transcriptional regulator with XRE-family HTH domain
MDQKLQKIIEGIGKELKSARIGSGTTQAELAEKVNSDTNYYAKIERGEVVPSLTLLIKIADTLEIEYADLFPKKNKK